MSNPVTEYSLFQGDCVKALLGQKPGTVQLAIADPPYNIGAKYDAHHDKLTYAQYMTWAGQWMQAAVHALVKDGSFWVFVPDEWVSEIDLMGRNTHGLFKRRHVIWSFTFGQAAQKNFSRSHCHLLYFTKSKTKYTFNDKAVRVPSARQLVYNDSRAQNGGKQPDATWMLLRDQLEPYMTPDKDTWLESRICGTFKERKKHSPNQIPVPIMERIVLACSKPGDTVLDLFCGTGSSGVAALTHNRHFIGYDISKTCIQQTKRRLNEVLHDRE